MTPEAQFDALLAEHLDGPPDAQRSRQLDDLLRLHPDLQGEYLEHMQLHALLQWRTGRATIGGLKEAPVAASTSSTARRDEKAIPVLVASSAPRWRVGRGLAAALLVVAASLAAFFLLQPPQAQATPDVVDRLIEWNLDLTQAKTSNERSRIYEDQIEDMKSLLARADLVAEDRVLADLLLENSALLVQQVDRIAEADRFSDIIDKLAARMEAATDALDEKRVVQMADAYQRVSEVGVKANLLLAEASALADVENRKKWDRLRMRHAHRTTHVSQIIERNPEPSRKAIHKAMKGHHKKKR